MTINVAFMQGGGETQEIFGPLGPAEAQDRSHARHRARDVLMRARPSMS